MGQMSIGLFRQSLSSSANLRTISAQQHTALKMQRLGIPSKHKRWSQGWGQRPSRPQLRSKLHTGSCPAGRPPNLRRKLGLVAETARVSDRNLYGSTFVVHAALAEAPGSRSIQRTVSRMPEFMLSGPVVAIVTPFKCDSLRVDDESLIKYLQYLWEHGIKNIIVNGTTGEFSSMGMEERMHVTELCREHWPGVIVNNVSSASHADVLKYITHSQQLVKEVEGEARKLEAALLLPPYYFSKVTDAGLERWLRLILEESRMPIYLYNFPDHTGNFVSADLFKRLTHDFPLLRGIKNTFNNVPLAAEFKGCTPERQVYVGFDGAYLQGLQAGLDGNVSSGGGAVLVNTFQTIHTAFDNGDTAAAEDGQRRMDAWAECREKLGVQDLPAAKAALSAVIPGFSATVRPPLMPATRDQQQALQQFIQESST